jgi:two-component system chemotaxis sensor kinase CheA
VAYPGIDDNRLKRSFIEEAEELLDSLNHRLLALERKSDDSELVNEVFRLTHSLKSESALIGFPHLSSVSHRLEDVFEKIRSGEQKLDKALMDGIFACADILSEMLSRIAQGGDDAGFAVRTVFDELDRLAASPQPPGAEKPAATAEQEQLNELEQARLQEASERGERLYRLVFRVAEDDPMKYPRAYLVFNNLEQKANVIRTIPDLTVPQEDERLYARVTILFSSNRAESELKAALQVDQVELLDLDPIALWPLGGSAEKAEWFRAEVRSREGERPAPANLRPGTGPAREGDGPAADPRAEKAEAADGRERSAGQELSPARMEKTSIRVEIRKLNDLWQLIGELIINKSRLARLFSRLPEGDEQVRGELEQFVDALDRIVTGMQQAMMETRMVPISVIFSKFPRLVRDLSKKLGKEAELELYGEETEIDRGIIEVLSDPLTHIIRNSLDHGLEPPEERRKLGKPPRGRVIISALQQGGKIVIEISDDGRGLDLARIRQKAGAPEQMSDEEVVNLIFKPGFSTKESVTDLSGRGVGMDVVATRIRQDLSGQVLVRSESGMGATFTIILPLVLNILNSLIVRCRGHYYAIPVQSIGETVKLYAANILLQDGGWRIGYRETSIPLYHLGELLGGGAEVWQDRGGPAPDGKEGAEKSVGTSGFRLAEPQGGTGVPCGTGVPLSGSARRAESGISEGPAKPVRKPTPQKASASAGMASRPEVAQGGATGREARVPPEPGMAGGGAEARLEAEEGYYGIIIRQREETYCLIVDELVEEQELVIKPIDAILNQQRLFSGISFLGDGSIVFILDTGSIEETWRSTGRQHGGQGSVGG